MGLECIMKDSVSKIRKKKAKKQGKAGRKDSLGEDTLKPESACRFLAGIAFMGFVYDYRRLATHSKAGILHGFDIAACR